MGIQLAGVGIVENVNYTFRVDWEGKLRGIEISQNWVIYHRFSLYHKCCVNGFTNVDAAGCLCRRRGVGVIGACRVLH